MNKTKDTDRLEQVLDATAHTGQYDDVQLRQLLSQEESRDYYRLMCDATSAYAAAHTESDEEINAAWEQFRQAHIPSRRPWLKIAAVFIGTLLLSGITFAAIHIFSLRTDTPPAAAVPAALPAQTVTAEPADTTVSRTFENAELQEILAEMASCYRLRTEFRSEEARHTRLYIKWNKAESAQTMVDKLNHFEKVSIKLSDDLLVVE